MYVKGGRRATAHVFDGTLLVRFHALRDRGTNGVLSVPACHADMLQHATYPCFCMVVLVHPGKYHSERNGMDWVRKTRFVVRPGA